MCDHLFEGKYVSPFRTDKPELMGRLKILELMFQSNDGINPKQAKEILQEAKILHGEFMSCEFCGQNNQMEHSDACPLYRENNEPIIPDFLLMQIQDWYDGFNAGLYNKAIPSILTVSPTFLLGFGRGIAKITKALGTDVLFREEA